VLECTRSSRAGEAVANAEVGAGGSWRRGHNSRHNALRRSGPRDPPPTRDEFGDNVRFIEWDPPIPIPNLSRFARFWLSRSARVSLPEPIANQVFAERAARLQDFAASADVKELMGIRDGADVLRRLPGEPSWKAMAFQQYYVPPGGGPPALVREARVTVLVGADGVSVRGITSSFQPALAPNPVEIGPDEAVQAAIATLTDLGLKKKADYGAGNGTCEVPYNLHVKVNRASSYTEIYPP
jgi:hypothetical protein